MRPIKGRRRFLPGNFNRMGSCYLTVFFILSLISGACFALPDDKQQILQVNAGSADMNQQTHQGIYRQAVELDQGSTHIRSAEATTTGDANNKLILAVIKGNAHAQAHYWTLTALDKPPLHAYADTIRYYPERHLIELIGHARVEQGNNSFSAHKIKYDTLAEHVMSESDGHTRTTIIFHPEKRT